MLRFFCINPTSVVRIHPQLSFYLRCKDSLVLEFLCIDPMVHGWNSPSDKLSYKLSG